MGRYRKVETRVWIDEKFRALSRPKPNAQTLFLYFLTGPNTTPAPGVFSATKEDIAARLGWTLKAFLRCFQELSDAGMVKADWNAALVWLPNGARHNLPQNKNVVIGWANAFRELPECELLYEAATVTKRFLEPLGEGFAELFAKRFREPVTEPVRIQEQEQEQNSLPTLSPEPEPVSPPPLRESFSGDAAPPQTLAPQTPQDPTTPEGFRLAWTAVRASRPVPLTDDAPAALHASAAVLLSRATGADPTWARAVIEAYHEQADEVVTRAGWSLRLFPHRINGLLAETKRALRSRSAQAASEAAMEPPMDALSQQEAAEAAREVLTRLKASKGVRV